MTTIGYATLQIIPSLRGVTEAINKQIDGKVVSIQIEPKVDQRAAEAAGKQARETVEKQTSEIKVAPKVDPKAADTAGRTARETVEKHTKQVTVEPKVDTRAAEQAGKTTGEAVAKGAGGSSTAIGQAIIGSLEGAGAEAGRRLGERLADNVPNGLTGAAQRIATALRNSLPTVGESAGTMLGTAIGVALTDAIGKERLDRAGTAVARVLTSAVTKANTGANIGIAIGNTISGGLSSASGAIGGAASAITDTIGGIGSALGTTKQLLGGDDSWAAPGLDVLNNALGTATPLLEGMNAASTLAAAGAQAISVATGIASKAQWLWNAALTANPIGLIVAAIAAVVAGLVLFFTKTELGQKIWKGFTEYLTVAWGAIKVAFGVAWDAIRAVWDAMVAKAGEVWSGIRDRFTSVVDFVKGLPGAITNAARGMWDGLKTGLVAVLNWIADKWNSFADGISFHIDNPFGDDINVSLPKLPHFSGGGYTGNVPIDKIAGVVHGGEHVIQATSRERIENAFPGLLDYMNNTGRLPGLPGYAEGGRVDKAKQFATSMDPAKYLMGGFSTSLIDCSGFVSAVVNVATGRPPFQSRMSTVTEGSWLKSLGFKSGSGGRGDLRVGWWDKGGGANGHTAGTFPDGTNFESNGSQGVVIGGKTGADDGQFTQHAYLPTESVGSPNGGDSSTTPAADMLSGLGLDSGGGSSDSSAAPEAATSSSTAPSGGSGGGVSVPSSLSGLSTFGLDNLGVTTKANADSPERTFDIGNAVSSAVGGQVSSALGVLGVPDSPGWLQGISKFVGGISVSEKGTGKKVFDGSNIGGTFGSAGSLFGGAAPVAAASAPVGAAQVPGGTVHGSQAGQKPGPVYNTTIQARDAEGALEQWQRKQDLMAASKIERFL